MKAASTSRYVPTEDRRNGPFDDYEVRSALETLARAEKIKRNKKLMRAVLAEAERQINAAKSTKQQLTGGK